MKIDLNNIDLENFRVDPHQIAGEVCWLIQPRSIAARWIKNTLIFRSSLWNSQGELISASFKKFFNFDEQPDLTYTPFSLTANGGTDIIAKVDGSTLIFSKYKGQQIIRTRGTSDASKLDNGYEISYLKDKYPKVFNFFQDDTSDSSLLFEWTTPTNKIVINYGDEPEIKLIARIYHEDYRLESQDQLDALAVELDVQRPKRYKFDSIKEMRETITALKGEEGVCIYCNYGQDIRKLKSIFYLAAHRLKSELGSFERVVDYWFSLNKPSYQDAEKHFKENFDFEVFDLCRGDISKICEAYKEVQVLLAHMNNFAQSLKGLSRKIAAEKIIQAYGQTNRAGMLFKMLDNKKLLEDDEKKLVYQVTKS